MSQSNIDSKVIVACDFNNLPDLHNFVDQVDPSLCKLKVGKEMFTYFGPDVVKPLVAKGFSVFLDLKFHDIPNTVAKACLAAADLGVWMVNVHASGGGKMMSHTRELLEPLGNDRPLLIAVTVLTSMDEAQLQGVVPDTRIPTQVGRLAKLTAESGFDGVVSSAHEVKRIKQLCGSDFTVVTPGIRPVGSEVGDQVRIMTPPDAIQAGVDYMVIGRPITQAAEPLLVLEQINTSIA